MNSSTRYWMQRTLGLVWLVLIVPSVVWWSRSILWVIFVSLYANAITHLGNAEAIKAQMRVEESNERQDS